ncbi:hypothetical protein CQ010_04045 [Arthrobacter sp. MYb211]|uniref:hypothetical protein n=1 Tax=unclassified Arthrobacter TaxID=235627 RepID=UPI000CFD8E26|nr:MULTISPECIES: hypothetical protein [unclassified Arthrobacter]PRA13731.1 hypothetical protein CQ015_00040 [Arthrobacter sp. MYb221]PRC09099.1 hypothetical protein CQ010_04045 [Arthrobacter sp. MYb211]
MNIAVQRFFISSAVLALPVAGLVACSSSNGGCPLPAETVAGYFNEQLPNPRHVEIISDEEQPGLCFYRLTLDSAEVGTYQQISVKEGFDKYFTEEDFRQRIAEYEAENDSEKYVRRVNDVPYAVDEERGVSVVAGGENYWLSSADYRNGVIHRPALASVTRGRDAEPLAQLLILTNGGKDLDGWVDASSNEQSSETAEPSETVGDSVADLPSAPTGTEGGVTQTIGTQAPGELAPPPEMPPLPPEPSTLEQDNEISNESTESVPGTDHELVGARLPSPDVLTAVFELWEVPGYPLCDAVLAGTSCVAAPVFDGDEVAVAALRKSIEGADDYTRDTAILMSRSDDDSWTVKAYWETNDPLEEFLPDWAK